MDRLGRYGGGVVSVPFPHHPEPMVMRWSELEIACITQYAAAVRAEAHNAALETARDIVDCVRFTSGADDYVYETLEQASQEMMRQIVEKKVKA